MAKKSRKMNKVIIFFIGIVFIIGIIFLNNYIKKYNIEKEIEAKIKKQIEVKKDSEAFQMYWTPQEMDKINYEVEYWDESSIHIDFSYECDDSVSKENQEWMAYLMICLINDNDNFTDEEKNRFFIYAETNDVSDYKDNRPKSNSKDKKYHYQDKNGNWNEIDMNDYHQDSNGNWHYQK